MEIEFHRPDFQPDTSPLYRDFICGIHGTHWAYMSVQKSESVWWRICLQCMAESGIRAGAQFEVVMLGGIEEIDWPKEVE